MTNGLPSSINVFVDAMDDEPVVRPWGKHPLVATSLAVAVLVTLGWLSSLMGIGEYTLAAISFMMVTIPPLVMLTCYSKTGALLWATNKWESQFMAALRVELGNGVTLENRTEFLISVRKGEPVDAVLRIGRFISTYSVVVEGDEVVMFNDAGFNRDWESVDAQNDHWH